MESSEFNSVFQQNLSMEQKLHEGKYFRIEKVKYKHRWEVRKSIQVNQKTNPVCIESIIREFEIGSQLQHPFICSYYQFSTDDNTIHREYIDGLTWNDYFEAYKEEISIYENYVIQLLDTIQYMHSKGIFHMDLKSENILINHELKTIKLIDFGHAVYRNDELWRGGVKATSNLEKLISAEHDWDAYFSVIQSLKSGLSKKSNVKLDKTYRLFLSNERRIDYQKTKLIFDDKTNSKYRIKLIAISSFFLIFIVGVNQMYKTEKPEVFINTTQPIVASTNTKSPFPIQSEKGIETVVHSEDKVKLNPEILMFQGKRVIPIKDSLFLINQASRIGPEFENRVKNSRHSLEKNRLLIEMIDTYELKFKNYLLTRKYDSIQIINAKKMYDHQISISMMNYYHLLK